MKYQDVRLKEYLNKDKGMKVFVEAFGVFKSKKTNEDVRTPIRSRRYNITNADEIPTSLSQMATDIEILMDRMELSESGLVIKQIDKIKFHYDKYNPTRGGSYIELPKWVSLKKACIKIKNEDDKCFKYCIQCGVYKVYEKGNPERISHYKKLTDELNWANVRFPASTVDIDTFEENNKDKIAINVFYIENESILIYRRTKNTNTTHQINLLLLDEGDKSHYVYIKNYDRLVGMQTNKGEHKKYHCFHCGHGFKQEETLKKHEEKGCMATKEQGKEQEVEMPEEREVMVFKNHYKKLKAPFVIYADFECLTQKTGSVSTKPTNTNNYQHHRPCGFMINVVNSIDGSSEPFLYRGEDCMDVFVTKDG